MRLTKHASYISNDTPILTKKGWKLARYIFPGDIIYDAKGHWTKVIYIEKAKKDMTNYRVTFEDTSFIEGTSKLELYNLNYKEKQTLAGYKIALDKLKTEAKLKMFSEGLPYCVTLDKKAYNYMNKLEYINQINLYNLYEKFSYVDYRCLFHYCPSVLAEPYRDKPMTIHPYLLGVWLVNGNRRRIVLNIKKKRIFEKLDELGYTLNHKEYTQYRVIGVKKYFRKLHLLEQKHIPYVYKYGSYKTRLSILEGILDGIGEGWNKQKRVKLVDTFILKDLHEMLFTMNVPVSCYSFVPEPYKDRVYRRRYVTKFSLVHLEEFHDVRDLEKYKINKNIKRWARIKNCEKKKQHQKFTAFVVSSNEHSFLAGTSLIPVRDNFKNINKKSIK